MKTSHQHLNQWIWQYPEFPNFYCSELKTEHLLYKFGQLHMLQTLIAKDFSSELLIDSLENEIFSTSAIEGDILQRSSVRSSINKLLRLGLDIQNYGGNYHIENLVQIITDAKTNLNTLDSQRLFAWHNALFQFNQAGLKKISIGRYRRHIEEMQIVSGSWEKPKVHYIAPPSEIVEQLMNKFFIWLHSDTKMHPIVKAAIAHLYFVLIHPFEDGNGRIARAITDYALAKANYANANFYSIAHAIYKNRSQYYDLLDAVCKQKSMDVTVWVEWFLQMIESSLDDTFLKIETIKLKTEFWDRCSYIAFNERQKKAVTKMVSLLPEQFQGGMKINKYMNLTHSTRITASRDLADLVEKKILQIHGAGRGVYYTLNV